MKFVLDTNIVSALMQPTVPIPVADWIGAQDFSSLYITTVTQAEIVAGLWSLPHGHRRERLEVISEGLFSREFAERVLPFCSLSARGYGAFFATRRRNGRPSGVADLMIAATAYANGASVVTRNTSDFDTLGLTLIDPWHNS
jgi:toxin FitB